MRNLSYRSLNIKIRRPATLDDGTRSMDFVIATEAPVKMFDFERGMIDEVLLAKGCSMPGQVPLLDNHIRSRTSDVLGSVRSKRLEDGLVVGTAVFSNAPNADEVYRKYVDGHLTDFSAGYTVNDVTRVEQGDVVKIDGRAWTGPVDVVTSWTLKEASCVPIGADDKAKVRSDQPTKAINKTIGGKPMDKEQFEDLKKTIGDLGTAVRSLVENQAKKPDERKAAEEIEKKRREAIKAPAMAAEAEKKRIECIQLTCAKMRASTGINFDDLQEEMIRDDTPEEKVAGRCLDRIASRQPDEGPRPRVGREEVEKVRDAAVDGLCIRAGVSMEKVGDKETEFQTMTLVELAKNRMQYFGKVYRGMNVENIVQRAMDTTDFTNILADVANKLVLEGFENAEETYDQWVDTGGRVNDFRTHVMARASEAPSLIQINPDGGEYEYGKMSDTKESVAVVDYGIMVPFTRRAMVDDDLGELASVREKLGAAARRKYGDLVYAVLTGNPAMGDGNNLFDDTNHSNHVDSGGAPDVAALNVGAKKMATQTDLQGLQNLNVRPVYILAPWALKGTVDNLLTTTSPTAPGNAASPVMNPWSYLMPVYEARLDSNSATAWYLAARRGMTVKLFTLNGNMTPTIESKPGWATDGMEFKCRVTAAAKAMDYRGLFKNDGA